MFIGQPQPASHRFNRILLMIVFNPRMTEIIDGPFMRDPEKPA